MANDSAADLDAFQESTLKYRFQHPEILEIALTHPSFAAEQKHPPPDNQRLEFLGDAVLELALSDLLFDRFPESPEGTLTVLRSVMCNKDALAGLARLIGLGAVLRLGKGETASGGRDRPSILADAFEAVLGAVHRDGGYEHARDCCIRLVQDFMPEPRELLAHANPKGALQELTQTRGGPPPTYRLLSVRGPEHLPEFEVEVAVGDRVLARAVAGSRRNAEKEAARKALETLKNADENRA
ncbi:MAG: ribonuclease III [Kiritimatiellaeota bacterium]|nr:ribonuclease III [Kiritimatiellota bacterium]